jgi:hypothetical protein
MISSISSLLNRTVFCLRVFAEGQDLIPENNRPAAVDQNTIRQMVADCIGKNTPFNIAPFAYKIIGAVTVTDRLNILCDNRALV